MSVAHRGGEQTSVMLGWAEQTGRAVELVLAYTAVVNEACPKSANLHTHTTIGISPIGKSTPTCLPTLGACASRVALGGVSPQNYDCT